MPVNADRFRLLDQYETSTSSVKSSYDSNSKTSTSESKSSDLPGEAAAYVQEDLLNAVEMQKLREKEEYELKHCFRKVLFAQGR